VKQTGGGSGGWGREKIRVFMFRFFHYQGAETGSIFFFISIVFFLLGFYSFLKCFLFFVLLWTIREEMEESIPSSFFFVMSLSHHIRASRKNITDHLINTLETEVEGKIVSFFQLFLFVCLLVSFLGGGGGGREEFFVVVLNLKFKARFLSFFFYFFFKIFFFSI